LDPSPDTNDITGRRYIECRAITQSDILGTGGVVKERIKTEGRIEAAGGVVKECRKAVGRVARAASVVKERAKPVAVLLLEVLLASAPEPIAVLLLGNGVGSKRAGPHGRVVIAHRILPERSIACGRVAAAGGVC